MDLYWLGKLVLIFGIVWSALLVVSNNSSWVHLFHLFCTNGLFLLLSYSLFCWGVKANHLCTDDAPTLETTEQTVKYITVHPLNGGGRSFAEKSRLFMQSDKPFLNRISRWRLSDALAIPAHHLSQVINEVFGLNFFNFVNRYRVDR